MDEATIKLMGMRKPAKFIGVYTIIRELCKQSGFVKTTQKNLNKIFNEEGQLGIIINKLERAGVIFVYRPACDISLNNTPIIFDRYNEKGKIKADEIIRSAGYDPENPESWIKETAGRYNNKFRMIEDNKDKKKGFILIDDIE